MKGYVIMDVSKIQGFNPFIKARDVDVSNAGKSKGVGHHYAYGKTKAKETEMPEAMGKGLSFLKEGALGQENALYVKGGRAGATQNLIA